MSDELLATLIDERLEHDFIGLVTSAPEVLDHEDVGAVRPADLHEDIARRALEAVQSLRSKGEIPSAVSVARVLLDAGAGDHYVTLVAWQASAPSTFDAPQLARSLMGLARRRLLKRMGERLAQVALSPNGKTPEAVVSAARKHLEELDQGRPGLSELLTGPEIFEMDEGGLEWLLPGHVPEASLCLLAGEVGGGKTWLALDLAVACAAGGATFGGLTFAEAAPVLYLGADNSKRTLIARWKALVRGRGIRPPAEFALSQTVLNLAEPSGVSRLRRMVEHSAARLVVVDVLARYLRGVDENQAGEVGPIMADLRSVANETGCAIVVLHHLNKAGVVAKAVNWLASIRGSVDLAGAVDVAWTLTTSGEWPDIARTLKQRKNRDAEEAEPVTYRIAPAQEGGLVLVWGDAPLNPAIVGRVLDLARANPGATMTDLAKKIGGRRDVALSTIRELARLGRLNLQPEGNAFKVLPVGDRE